MKISSNYTLTTPMDLMLGDHICCLYESDHEQRATLRSFVQEGWERGEKIIHIMDELAPSTGAPVFRAKRGDGLGKDGEREALCVLAAQDVYLRGGAFHPDEMLSFFKDETDRALSEGYAGLRVSSEMTWALRKKPGSDELIEFEAKLDAYLPHSKCMAMCRWDLRRFPPILLLYAMATHPIVMIGEEVYENVYYMPPPEFLARRGIPVATLHHWLESLAIRKRTIAACQTVR
ncbi:MAG: MEDS domain-containing protein [Syntrophobacteraceae bacterium]